MSIVDTWDWDKLKAEYEKDQIEMNADMEVQSALYEFENNYGIRPNRITMGYRIVDELTRIFIDNVVSLETLEELAKAQEHGIVCEYEGIPINVDHDNPDTLEVGFMVKWMENNN